MAVWTGVFLLRRVFGPGSNKKGLGKKKNVSAVGAAAKLPYNRAAYSWRVLGFAKNVVSPALGPSSCSLARDALHNALHNAYAA